MALVSVSDIGGDVRLGLWRMDEEPGELLELCPCLRLLDMPFTSLARQKEFLCVRALLVAMTGDEALRIEHNADGRPVAAGWQLSVSHTRGYAALMLSRKHAVGVDIEYRSDRIVRIASHFIRSDEEAVTADEMLALWCAKETLYKLHSDDHLQYAEMRLLGRMELPAFVGDGRMPASQPGLITIENMKRGATVNVHVEATSEYLLTWAVE